ncbi:MAG TPA: DUF1552 domain-containing protein [Polyangiaceae bacterium]
MTPKKGALNRRTFLRGALQGGGVAVLALPLLEAMLDSHGEALAAGTPLPRRFVSWFFGNGVQLDLFEPNMPGSASYALSPLLQDLADVKDYLTVCTGLQNPARLIQSHHEGLTAFTGYDYIDRPDLPGFASDFGGPTIDQVIADHLAGSTPVHSLQFQVTKGFSPADSGATSQHVSAQGPPGGLVYKRGESNPKKLWASLFGMSSQPTGVRGSMLDFLKQDITKMRGRLGAADQLRMDAHLQALRELEATIACSSAPSEPTETNEAQSPFEPVTTVNSIMAQLLAISFACDVTRVASVLFLPLAGEVTFGVDVGNTDEETHHSWSHNRSGTGADGQNAYEQNIRYIMNRFGDWMRALKAQVEPNGTTLLDSTILFASSDCAYGSHMINRQPILLGGHGRGHLVHPGIHFQAIAGNPALGTLNLDTQPAARNTSDVLLTCLNAFNPAATSVGDLTINPNFPSKPPTGSTTPLTEIEA